MGKTYEVLQWAEKEYQKVHRPESISEIQKPILTGSDSRDSQFTPFEPFDNLKTNFLSRYAGDTVKSVMFNGIRHGGGCSTTTLNFANSLAIGSTRKVLLIDVNLRTPVLHKIYKDANTPDLGDLVSAQGQGVSQIRKIGKDNFYVISCGNGDPARPLEFFESSEFERFIDVMYANFDYLILDAPPVIIYPEVRVLCSKVDGVVLVLKSGNTRRQVAIQAKKTIEDAGGNILGVVINSRRYYIPEWIYKRL